MTLAEWRKKKAALEAAAALSTASMAQTPQAAIAATSAQSSQPQQQTPSSTTQAPKKAERTVSVEEHNASLDKCNKTIERLFNQNQLLSQLTNNMTDLEARHTARMEEANRLSTDNHHLKKQVQELQAKTVALDDEHMLLQIAFSALTAENQFLRAQLQGIESSNANDAVTPPQSTPIPRDSIQQRKKAVAFASPDRGSSSTLDAMRSSPYSTGGTAKNAYFSTFRPPSTTERLNAAQKRKTLVESVAGAMMTRKSHHGDREPSTFTNKNVGRMNRNTPQKFMAGTLNSNMQALTEDLYKEMDKVDRGGDDEERLACVIDVNICVKDMKSDDIIRMKYCNSNETRIALTVYFDKGTNSYSATRK